MIKFKLRLTARAASVRATPMTMSSTSSKKDKRMGKQGCGAAQAHDIKVKAGATWRHRDL